MLLHRPDRNRNHVLRDNLAGTDAAIEPVFGDVDESALADDFDGTSGNVAMNSSTNGASTCSAAVASALIRNAPESLEVNSPSSSATSAISTSAGRSLAKKRLPASVSDTLRVERWKSSTLRRLSKLATLWLRAEGLRPLRRAAARNPLYSATAAWAASVSFSRNYPP
jgi:hypothetical protein